MTFYDWLVAQCDRPDPIGDLARDAPHDRTAPRRGSPQQWRAYLRHHPGAGRPARRALEAAIREFGA